MTLSEEITREVWSVLYRRPWFGKHVEDGEIDALYEDISTAVATAVEERAA